MGTERDEIAVVHDYLTQRGGAERTVVALTAAFPNAPIFTSLYEPSTAFPAFDDSDIRVSQLNRFGLLRKDHRLALPVLAPAFSGLKVDAAVTICSSSGWAHGATTTGRKVVYCHTPARWLYQPDVYTSGLREGARTAVGLLGPALRSWDRHAASRADRYLVNSNEVKRRVADLYGIEAEVVPPPVAFTPAGPAEPIAEVEPGFFLCVSRLLPYKNVHVVVEAFASLPDQRLVVVGDGPLFAELDAERPRNVTLLGKVDDACLRWLYASCQGVLSASYEDFGLTPIEAAYFAKPVGVLRWGGFLDTTREGETGVFFDQPTPALVARSVRELQRGGWEDAVLRAHAESYSADRFVARIRAVVDEELKLATGRAAHTSQRTSPVTAATRIVFGAWKQASETATSKGRERQYS